VLERVTEAVLIRQEELARTRASSVVTTPQESPGTFLDRVRRFLGIA
jgi:hypothetical protein